MEIPQFLQKFLNYVKTLVRKGISVAKEKVKKIKGKLKHEKLEDNDNKSLDEMLDKYSNKTVLRSLNKKLYARQKQGKVWGDFSWVFSSIVFGLLVITYVVYEIYKTQNSYRSEIILWVFLGFPFFLTFFGRISTYYYSKLYPTRYRIISVYFLLGLGVSFLIDFLTWGDRMWGNSGLIMGLAFFPLSLGFLGYFFGDIVGDKLVPKKPKEKDKFEFLILETTDEKNKISENKDTIITFINQISKTKLLDYGSYGDDEVIYIMSHYRRLLFAYYDNTLVLSVFRREGRQICQDKNTKNTQKQLEFLLKNVLNFKTPESSDTTVFMKSTAEATLFDYGKESEIIEFIRERKKPTITIIIVISSIIFAIFKKDILLQFLKEPVTKALTESLGYVIVVVVLAFLNYLDLLPKRER